LFFCLLASSFSIPAAAEEPRHAESLVVQVRDPQGLAIVGASVNARTNGTRVARITDVSGVARLQVEFPVEIEVRAAGFEPETRRINTPPAALIVMQLALAIMRSTVDVVVRDEWPATESLVASTVRIDRTAARTVFDAIDAMLPAVSVTRRGVMGYGIATNGTGGVSIRGIGGQPNTDVLVVVDGRPDMQSLMGHPLPDAYSLSDAQTVSVTEGPASVLYGSNAMGGVIEIQTTQPPEGTHGRVSTAVGSFLTGQHRLAFGSSGTRGYYSLTAGMDHTDGDRPSSAYRGATATVNAGAQLSSTWKANLQGRFTDFRVEDPGPITAPLIGSAATVDRGGLSVNLENTRSRTWGYARGYAAFGHHVITDGFRSVDRTIGLRVQQSFAAGRQTVLDVGSDVTRFGGRARNLPRINYGRHDGTDAAVFVRAQLEPAAGLQLHGGLRYDRDSFSGGILVPEIGAALRLNDRTTVSVDAARGFRNPTIRELYLFPAPNPTLKPERLWNYQASLQIRPVATLTASATVYYADVSNLIITQGQFPNLILSNAGKARNHGMEGTVRWRPAAFVQINAGYAYLRSTNLAPLVPAHKLTYSADLLQARFAVNVSGITVGSRWADARHSVALSGYTTIALKATVPTGRRVTLFATVDNLLNEAYQVVPGYPMPGTNAMAGMTVAF
jgi:outer membrane receptor protein involved in Fe transport